MRTGQPSGAPNGSPTSPVHLKRVATTLFERVTAGDPAACATYDAVWPDRQRPASMARAQHVVAINAGYALWDDVMAAKAFPWLVTVTGTSHYPSLSGTKQKPLLTLVIGMSGSGKSLTVGGMAFDAARHAGTPVAFIVPHEGCQAPSWAGDVLRALHPAATWTCANAGTPTDDPAAMETLFRTAVRAAGERMLLSGTRGLIVLDESWAVPGLAATIQCALPQNDVVVMLQKPTDLSEADIIAIRRVRSIQCLVFALPPCDISTVGSYDGRLGIPPLRAATLRTIDAVSAEVLWVRYTGADVRRMTCTPHAAARYVFPTAAVDAKAVRNARAEHPGLGAVAIIERLLAGQHAHGPTPI